MKPRYLFSLFLSLIIPLVCNANIAAGTEDTWTIKNNTSDASIKIHISLPPEFLMSKAEWVTPTGQQSDFYSLPEPIKLSIKGDYKLIAQSKEPIGTSPVISNSTLDCRFIKDAKCYINTIPTYSHHSGSHILSIDAHCTVRFDNNKVTGGSTIIDSDLSHCDRSAMQVNIH